MARAVSPADNNQAELTVIDVVPAITADIGIPPGGPVPAELQAALVSRRYSELESLVAPYRQHRSIRTNVLAGHMFLEVIRAVLRNGAGGPPLIRVVERRER